ncbi:hyalin-like isoform X4 [Strongylocentrotus purpuratus]|uniref:Hyalin n=1 Tax=Strongylocentrotus purpuratus TaxID=7668 RepID=A0A7M7NK79_STRPU|nr:hyalin-like isoform X4 [Strongylocentrotus purpuratus]
MALGQNFSTVSWTEPTVIDNSDTSDEIGFTFDGGETEGTNPGNFTQGITSLSYTAVDTAGNRASCMFEIVVSDTEEPVIVGCPLSKSVPMQPGQNFATVSWTEPTVSDNSYSVTLTFNGEGTNAGDFSLGITSLSYTAVDAAGNRATCMFEIVVSDNEEPAIRDCPSSQFVPMALGQNFSTVSWTEPTVIDNSDTSDEIGVTFDGEGTNPGNFTQGITSLSYTAVDTAGNRATCMFEIVVSDNEEPAIRDCPSSQFVPMALGQNFSTVSWTEPTVIDNSDTSDEIGVTFDGEGTNPGNFTQGITSLSYTAVDTAGNRATCMFEIVVSDNEEPAIRDCPSSQFVPMALGQNFSTVSWTEPTVIDNSDTSDEIGVTFDGEGTNPGNFTQGITSLSYTAVDTAGNRATCMFEIVVSDTEEPVIVGCPLSKSVPMQPGQNFATVSWTEPTVSENSYSVTLTFNGEGTNAGDFSLGITSLSYTAVDAAGNRATCMFEIVVSDTEEPVIDQCPSTQSVSTELNQDFAMVSWVEPRVTDNSNDFTQKFNGEGTNPGNFPIGITSLSYTAVDAQGNTATCMFAIVVSDHEAPIITDCPSSQTLTTELGSETATAIWAEPTASDNSNSMTLTPSRSGDAFPVGQNIVTYAAQDPSGNTATCTFVISVMAPLGCSTSQLISCRDTETCVQNECRCRPAFIRLNDVCTEANKFSISVRALTLNGIDYEYTDALSDPNSPEFQAEANNFIIVMMQNTDTIYGVTVIEIQRGSLIFVAEAITEPSTTMAQLQQDIDSAIQEGSTTAGPTTISFAPDDTVIADINECASTTTNDCSENANCTNMVGSYTCTCHFGYTDRSPAGVGPARVCELTSLGSFLGVGGIIGVAIGASVLMAILFSCCIIAVRRMTHNNFAQRKRDPQTNVHLSSFRRAGDQRARRQGPGRPGDVFGHDDNLYRGYVGGTRGSTPKSEFMGY